MKGEFIMAKNCKIIFIGNYKGGVGKTTTVINLAAYLSEENKKVLTIDLDPQSSLSEIQVKNFLEKDLDKIPDENTLNYVFDLSMLKIKKYPTLELNFSHNIIQKKKDNDNYHFILSTLFYRNGIGLDTLALQMEGTLPYLAMLKNYVDSIKDCYDYILIDCPPSNNIITQSAILMSDYYLIPTILDKISTKGVFHYIKTVDVTYSKYCENGEDAPLIKPYFGNRPELIGLFFNMIRGPVNYEDAMDHFVNNLNNENSSNKIHLFEEKIHNYIDIARSTGNGELEKNKIYFAPLFQKIIEQINNKEEARENNDNKTTD